MGIRVGVIGCGYWGKNILRNLTTIKHAEIRMAAESNKKLISESRHIWPSINFVSDYRRIINSSEVDAVIIATPIDSHYHIAKEALEKNKHVLVEKPMTCKSTQARQLYELAKKKKRILMVDHTFIYSGAVRKLKNIIDSGEIGQILYYDSVRVNLGLFQRDQNVVWDLAPHDLSIMRYIINEKPVSVSAKAIGHFHNKIEDIAYMNIIFRKKMIAHFHLNWLAPVKTRLTLIGGSKKMIVYDDTEPSEKIKIYDKHVKVKTSRAAKFQPLYDYRVGDMYAPKIDLTEALKYVCEEFITCIRSRKKPISDARFGIDIVEMLEAAQKSIRYGGKEVKL